MTAYRSQIARHRDSLNRLHARVHATFRMRDRSQDDRRAWEQACREFREFRSGVDELLDRVGSDTVAGDAHLREFVFDFLSVDPIHFRSGYAKERLLRSVKRLELTDQEREVLRETILRRVRDGALREFRRFCQLMPKIQTEDFVAALRSEAQSTDEATRRRAAFALRYVVEHQRP